MHVVLLVVALFGHGLLWVAGLSRLHSVGLRRRTVKRLSGLWLLLGIALPVVVLVWLAGSDWDLRTAAARWPQSPWTVALVFSCLAVWWIAAAVNLLLWGIRPLLGRPPHVVRWHRRRTLPIDAAAAAVNTAEHAHHYLVRLPGNQTLRLDLSERLLDVPRLPAALHCLSIVHLSDLHFTGRVGKAYFREVVRIANQLRPDLMAVTGDLVDSNDCLDWIPDTLGQLAARFGVYYVLGNHDLRADVVRLRAMLAECGLVNLGSRWIEVRVRDQPVILAGNELPWLTPAADLSTCPPSDAADRPLRIALAHSPDQLAWARASDIDLMLAGHTHGGQIRLPWIGALVAPSRRGVRYASGLFHEPPTIMHVTRGVSGEFPLRLNCPPEMARLILHRPSPG